MIHAVGGCGCKVVALVKRGKRGDPVSRQFRDALKRWAVLSEAAYGSENRIPKFHFSGHLPRQLELDGFIQDCFATERQNSMWITAASGVKNTSGFEKSVVLRAFSMHLNKLGSLKRDGLIGEQRCESLGVDAYVAKSVQLEGSRFWGGDVVLLDNADLILVRTCARFGPELALVGSELRKAEALTLHSNMYEQSEDWVVAMVAGHVVRLATAWSFAEDGRVLVIR